MTTGTEGIQSDRLYGKIMRRLMPMLMLLYVTAFFDRISIAFAGPNGMTADLGMSATQFGFASGIFIAGYILLELPSNLALHKFGARIWLARIIITWGIVQCLTAFVPNATVLNIMRLALGLAEAGFAPGVIFYLTLWFPRRHRVRATAIFLIATTLANIFGVPVANGLIALGNAYHPFGLVGWRFLFLAGGVPAILLGILSLKVLFDGPAEASWLSAREKEALAAELASDRSEFGVRDMPLSETLTNPKIWLLGLAYFGVVYGGYSLTFFLPTMVEGFQHRFGGVFTGWSKTFLTQIPYIIAAFVLLLIGYLVDECRGKLGKYALILMTVAAISAVSGNYSTEPYLLVILDVAGVLSASSSGAALVGSVIPELVDGRGGAARWRWSAASEHRRGFFRAVVMGWLKDLTSGYSVAMWIIAVILVFSGAIIFMINSSVRKRFGLYSSKYRTVQRVFHKRSRRRAMPGGVPGDCRGRKKQ